MKIEYALTLHKNISQWFKDLNIRHDAIKLLEENMGKMFSDINWTFFFLRSVSQGHRNKTKYEQRGLDQTYKFLHSKENCKKKKKKRQPKEWEKIFANDAIDQGLISNIQTIQFNNNNNNKNNKKNVHKTLIDISPKKTCRWPVDT